MRIPDFFVKQSSRKKSYYEKTVPCPGVCQGPENRAFEMAFERRTTTTDDGRWRASALSPELEFSGFIPRGGKW